MDTTSGAGSGAGAGSGSSGSIADVCPCSTVAATAHNEQPQTKRQKIEKQIRVGSKSLPPPPPSPPDILDRRDALDANSNNNKNHHLCSSLSSSSTHSLSTPSSTNNSPTTTPCSSRATSYAQLLSVQSLVHNILPQSELQTDPEATKDEVDRAAKLPDLLTITTGSSSIISSSNSSCNISNRSTCIASASSSIDDMLEFEQSLTRQCLCGVSERTLRKPFQSHYSQDTNGQKRIAYLREWPTNKLLQFLSNLQLLFDIYLKQNAKGFICTRIMDVCDALIRNDNKLIDEIIVLAGYNNSYVQFLAGRVLAAFLVIAKQELNDEWLQKIVDQLFNFEHLDQAAVQKIHFSLDIIKRIVEWKDIETHPLDDDWMTSTTSVAGAAASSIALPADAAVSYMHFPVQDQPLATNYFALQFREDAAGEAEREREPESRDRETERRRRNGGLYDDDSISPHPAQPASVPGGCHVVTLTDSESFDTTHLKCITIQKLEHKWPTLVKNMSELMAPTHQDTAEHCVLNFLQLWENIISVKANLSIDETRPYYAQLDKFELLLNHSLSCTVYKQMLCLFNEALCYGSTLALQDMLPEETCKLAHQIVCHVRGFRILESLPRRQPDNMVSLIGYNGTPLVYANGAIAIATMARSADAAVQDAGEDGAPMPPLDLIEMDKTLLQKMVLLVLKSIAVTVKEIRSDSSDSSIDSSDYDAFQDMMLIERSIRDVLSKLETFIKQTLEFHPECHFSKILIHLFDDQDDHLIEAMVCTLDVTSGISFRNNAFPELVAMLNPVYTFLEFLKMTSNSSDLLLDLLVSNETCFLLYLLRLLKYIRMNWTMFVHSCHSFGMGNAMLDEAMGVLIRLRLQISRLVSRQLYPYDISPVLRLLESCESLYEGNELS
ncbi:protein lines [Drosophila persimilis]|uniref:protein lines n=1 Tax=Drosophila persimilis TaxID=7234 RepID=UPI000F08223C|nr:protein lines [Drosophila persimilis]XP_026841332.1 protein lines [Drosophila persimilis]